MDSVLTSSDMEPHNTKLSRDFLGTRTVYAPAGVCSSVPTAAPLELRALALCELLDLLPRHRLQLRQKGFHLPLRRVISQDELLRLCPDDVGHPVVHARLSPPHYGDTAPPNAAPTC